MAARLIREKMAEGVKVNLLEQLNLAEGDHPDVFVTEGRIAEFDYLEVIYGKVEHPDVELPLIVLIHGRGDRPRIPQGPTTMDPPVRLFIPRGPDRLGDGFNWLATYTRSQKEELLVRSLAPRADQLAEAIGAFTKLRPTQGKPIVAGFSQGGIMTYGLYARHPQLFRAAFPIAGWLPKEMVPKSAKRADFPPLQAQHGGADEIVPTDLDRKSVAHLQSLGLRAAISIEDGLGHEVSPHMNQMVRLWISGLLAPKKYPQRWVDGKGFKTK
jgi:phospholipase/carboxylesterase